MLHEIALGSAHHINIQSTAVPCIIVPRTILNISLPFKELLVGAGSRIKGHRDLFKCFRSMGNSAHGRTKDHPADAAPAHPWAIGEPPWWRLPLSGAPRCEGIALRACHFLQTRTSVPRTMAGASTSVSTRPGATYATAGTGTGSMRTGTTARKVRPRRTWEARLTLASREYV